MAMEIHGIKLVGDIQDAKVQSLAVDPTYTSAGYVWFNTAEKRFKMTTLDGSGAVIKKSFANLEELQSEITRIEGVISTLDTEINARIDSEVATLEGTIATNASTAAAATLAEETRAKGVEGSLGSLTTAVKTNLVAAVNSAVADYKAADIAINTRIDDLQQVVATGSSIRGAFQSVSGLATLDETTLVDGYMYGIRDTNDVYVYASALSAYDYQPAGWDGGFIQFVNVADVTNAISTEASVREAADLAIRTGAGLGTEGEYVANAVANYIASASSLADADNKLDTAVKGVDTRLTTVEGQVNGKVGTLTSLTTDAKSNLVAAINEVDAHIDSEVTNRTAAVAGVQSALDAEISNRESEITRVEGLLDDEVTARAQAITDLKSAFNATKYKVTTTTAATSHVITHGLNSMDVDFTVWVNRGDGVWRNDQVEVKITDANSITIGDFGSARNVKVVVTRADAIA